jgi:hypothetical protein
MNCGVQDTVVSVILNDLESDMHKCFLRKIDGFLK